MKKVDIDIKQTLHIGVHCPPEPVISKVVAAIDRIGDEQNGVTNVKATMTSYWSHLHHHEDFGELYCWIDNLICNIQEVREDLGVSNVPKGPSTLKPYGQNRYYYITNFWGMRHDRGNSTFIHNHCPSIYSFVYYLKVDNPSRILFYDDTTEMKARWSVTPRDHTLIVFPGHLKHSVEEQQEGQRYAISGNINTFERTEDNVEMLLDFCYLYPEIATTPLH